MPVALETWEQARESTFDLAIFALGYEHRSRYIASIGEISARRSVCIDFEQPIVFSYEENKRFYQARNVRPIPLSASNFRTLLAQELLLSRGVRHKASAARTRIFLDCSSLTRKVAAEILLLVTDIYGPRADVCIAYALSSFVGAPHLQVPSYISEPVTPVLAGWSNEVEKAPFVVAGLGYEPGRALGCLDYLEATAAAVFLPQGPDPRFLSAVLDANDLMLQLTDPAVHVKYDVLDPFDTYQKLESLTFGAMRRYRVVLVPLGPKIFAALCALVGIEHYPNVCVWRVSGGDYDAHTERTASGQIACIRFTPLDRMKWTRADETAPIFTPSDA